MNPDKLPIFIDATVPSNRHPNISLELVLGQYRGAAEFREDMMAALGSIGPDVDVEDEDDDEYADAA